MCFLNENQNIYLLKLQPEQDFNVTVFFLLWQKLAIKKHLITMFYNWNLMFAPKSTARFIIYSANHFRAAEEPQAAISQVQEAHFSSTRGAYFWAIWNLLLRLAFSVPQMSFDPTRAERAYLWNEFCVRNFIIRYCHSTVGISVMNFTFRRGTFWALVMPLIYCFRGTRKQLSCCWERPTEQKLRRDFDLSDSPCASQGNLPSKSHQLQLVLLVFRILRFHALTARLQFRKHSTKISDTQELQLKRFFCRTRRSSTRHPSECTFERGPSGIWIWHEVARDYGLKETWSIRLSCFRCRLDSKYESFNRKLFQGK